MKRVARVLVVDDDPNNRDILEQELEPLGCAALTATNGWEALALLSARQADLVLLDIMMPGMDGIEVLRRIKTSPGLRHIPVVMISAQDDLDKVVLCITMGAEDYLPKPVDPVLLRARVAACFDKKRWRDQETEYLERIRSQLEEIGRKRERVEQLLHVILPAPAVVELEATGGVLPRRYERVAVLFADIVGFTGYCETHAPEEVVDNLGRLIDEGERVIAAEGMEKIKTIGDGLMATANLLEPHDDPVMASLRCAFALSRAARQNPAAWDLRIGIHIGPVMAGVVGRTKFSFDLWGDTVNVAARLSDLGMMGAIHLSRDAWSDVEGRCRSTALGLVPLRGRGGLEVYRCDDGTGLQPR
ncbi:MAG TPA: adenylate/guanylate cyclase domain-containing protein [Alphaproteobacteria bacterium]|nr:adenylate/guanylate cyclase domain-containing protein [Alphaproteobacteria bacterium]